MEAILKFNLPEDKMEFNRCNNATAMALALWDISNLWTKHNKPKSVNTCLDRINEILLENNIDINSLVE